jgi:hypothetical protein
LDLVAHKLGFVVGDHEPNRGERAEKVGDLDADDPTKRNDLSLDDKETKLFDGIYQILFGSWLVVAHEWM